MLSKICCLSTDSCKGSCLGFTRNQNVKIAYIVIFLLLLLVSHFKNTFHLSQQFDVQHTQQLKTYNCDQVQVKYQEGCVIQKKITLDFTSLAVFHLIILFVMVPKTKHIKVVNQGLWFIKIFGLAAIIAIVDLTFGPNLSGWIEFIAIWVSPLLYIVMNIVIVDNIYLMDFKLNQFSQKHRKLHIFKIILSILIWILAIVANFFSYLNNQLWISVFNSVLIGILLIITLLRVSKNNSLFVYALIVLHLNLTSYSIHTEENDSQRNVSIVEHGYKIFTIFLTILWMLSPGGNQIRTKKSTINEILALNTTKKQEDNRYVSSNKWLVYHCIMALIFFTFPVVFCYQYHTMKQSSGKFVDIGRITWWVSLVLIYLWSILAQKVYPEQDLSQLQNYFKEFQLN